MTSRRSCESRNLITVLARELRLTSRRSCAGRNLITVGTGITFDFPSFLTGSGTTGQERRVRNDGSGTTGQERRVRNDGSGTTGQERRVRNDGSGTTGQERWVGVGINTQVTDLFRGSIKNAGFRHQQIRRSQRLATPTEPDCPAEPRP